MREKIHFWFYRRIYYWNPRWWQIIYYKIPSLFFHDIKYILKFDLSGYKKFKEWELLLDTQIEKAFRHSSKYSDYSFNVQSLKLRETAQNVK